MIRVALITHGFEGAGGVASVARWLHRGLEERGGYEVDVHDLATSSRDANSRRVIKPRSWSRRTLRVRASSTAPYCRWGANAVELELMRYRPRRELREVLRSYDIVQVVAGSPAWGAAVVRQGFPVVLQVATLANWERESQVGSWSPGLRLWRGAMTKMVGRTERLALLSADRVLVENSTMLEHVHRLGQGSAIKAPPGVDTNLFQPHASGLRMDGYILSVCRLGDPRKGIERIIGSYSKLRKIRPRAPRLLLAGKGPTPPEYLDLVDRLGLASHVAFLPDVPGEELPGLYRGASLFAQGSYEEGLGLSVLEAMASGLPVVSTDTHGSRECVRSGVTGWLVPQLTEKQVVGSMAEKMDEALGNQARTLGSAGRKRCEAEFSREATLRRFTDVYEEILSV